MILLGKDLIIKADGVAIAAAKSASVKIQADTINVSSPTDGQWEHSIIGRKSWSVSADHLVLSLGQSVARVGDTVTLELYIQGRTGQSFDGLVENVTVDESYWRGTPDHIYWDKTSKRFVGAITVEGTTYYHSMWWKDNLYVNPLDYDIYIYNNMAYTYIGGELYAEKLTGQAHVKSWDVQGAVGALAHGSFQFLGTGPLT